MGEFISLHSFVQPRCNFSPNPLLYISNSPGHFSGWYNINHFKAEPLNYYNAQFLRQFGNTQVLGPSPGTRMECWGSLNLHFKFLLLPFNLLRPRATLGGPWHWLTAPLASSTRLKWVTIVEIHLNGCWCQNLVILYNCTHICVLHIIDCVCNFRA